MDKRFIAWIYMIASSRPALMLMLTVIMFLSVPIMLFLLDFIIDFWGETPTDTAIKEIMESSDGIATIFVMLGVFLESRETLSRIVTKHLKFGNPGLEDKLNKLSSNFGVGFLLNGLLMEISTSFLNIPDHIIDSRGFEKPVFIFIMFMCLFCMYSIFNLNTSNHISFIKKCYN